VQCCGGVDGGGADSLPVNSIEIPCSMMLACFSTGRNSQSPVGSSIRVDRAATKAARSVLRAPACGFTMSASGLPSIGSGLRITIDTDARADPAVFDDHAAPMLPGGYSYTCTIVATPSCVVVGATRDSDGQPVLLQWEPGRSLASVFDTMRTMSACGVAPTPTGMVACFGGMAVEATFPRGCSLLELVANRGGFLSPRVRRVHACVPTGNPNLVARAQALVSVSARLARSLAQFHAKHIIFRDLNPNVIFVDDAGEEDASGVLVFANLCLAGDFASQPTGAASLAYVAPEEVS